MGLIVLPSANRINQYNKDMCIGQLVIIENELKLLRNIIITSPNSTQEDNNNYLNLQEEKRLINLRLRAISNKIQ